jgi:hypothetical protein
MLCYLGINSVTSLEEPEVFCRRTAGFASKACENKVWENQQGRGYRGVFGRRRGEHLTLWDLGLDTDFPPGFTILIPSARNVLFVCRRTKQELRQRELDGERRWRDSEELFSKMSDFEAGYFHNFCSMTSHLC